MQLTQAHQWEMRDDSNLLFFCAQSIETNLVHHKMYYAFRNQDLLGASTTKVLRDSNCTFSSIYVMYRQVRFELVLLCSYLEMHTSFA